MALPAFFANEISAVKTNPSTESQPLLIIYNVTQSGLYTGVTIVGQQPRNSKWKVNFDSNYQNDCADTCLQERLGRLLSEIITTKWQITHKCIGAGGNQASSVGIFKDVLAPICTYSGRQYNSSFLSKNDER